MNARQLQIGDRVGFDDSSVCATGVIIEEVGSDYLKVQWSDCPVGTTHRRHALEFKGRGPTRADDYRPAEEAASYHA